MVVYYLLFIAFLGTAALNMLHVRGGFLTNHVADLVGPAWLCVAFRGLHSRRGRTSVIQRTERKVRCCSLTKLHCVAALALTALLTASCGDGSTEPTSADRGKFVGTWVGSYSCLGGAPVSDRLVISLGDGALDFTIIIHAGFGNPDTVAGNLTEPNLIKVPQQSMGGAPGTAQITSQGALLEYRQTGFGITCGGPDYARVP